MIKRIFDLLFASLVVIFLFPFFIVIAVLIKLDSPGPIFYKGVRTGRYGKPFKEYKFRTMYADKVLGNRKGFTTGKNDSRITKVGRFLRKFKIDEFPQVINIFKNEMSVVGPRPEVQEYTDLYEGDEKLILTVKPGITDYSSIYFFDLAEICGKEDDAMTDTHYEEKVKPIKNKLRVKYVKESSFLVDLKIIFFTVARFLNIKPT
jgi:lipopolysaccharide/colanic/teichoic acid biosynthesis glycosyltransferase